MEYIDIENWSRKKHFEFFSQLDYPHFNICFELDITSIYKYVKDRNISIFKALLYFVVRTANEIKQFRYRIRKDKVVLHRAVHPSVTVRVNEEEFSFCPVEYVSEAEEFFEKVNRKIKEVKNNPVIEDHPDRDDFLFITSIPWISFTAIQHPVNITPADSVPRIAWGKFFPKNKKIKLPFSIQAHHGLMDGIHMGKYRQNIQKYFNCPGRYLPKHKI